MMQAISRWLLPGKNTGQVLIDRGVKDYFYRNVRKTPADEAVCGQTTPAYIVLLINIIKIYYFNY